MVTSNGKGGGSSDLQHLPRDEDIMFVHVSCSCDGHHCCILLGFC